MNEQRAMNEQQPPRPLARSFPLHRDWSLSHIWELHRSPNLERAWLQSREWLTQIRDTLRSGPDWPGVETMYVVGSLGRMECVRGSDCDLVVVLRDDCSPNDTAIVCGLDALWERLEQIGVQRPKAHGIYARPTSVGALWNPDSIGQVDESIDVFGKRIQLILEGQPVYADSACQRLLQQMLTRYAGGPLPHPTVGSDDSKQWSYLLNDLIRYFRSLCVRTQWLRDPAEWTVLNTKLRHSRLLSYAGLLLLLGEASSRTGNKLEWLASRMRMTPMERIAWVFGEHGSQRQFANIAHYYDTFLEAMDAGCLSPESEQRPASIQESIAGQDFQKLKQNSTALIQELLQFICDRRGDWKSRFFEFLVF